MHTIHEGNYTVVKLPRNENSKAKKINKKKKNFSLWKLSNTTIVIDALNDFTHIIHW